MSSARGEHAKDTKDTPTNRTPPLSRLGPSENLVFPYRHLSSALLRSDDVRRPHVRHGDPDDIDTVGFEHYPVVPVPRDLVCCRHFDAWVRITNEVSDTQ